MAVHIFNINILEAKEGRSLSCKPAELHNETIFKANKKLGDGN